jgi:hypothetical protein
VSDLYPEMLAAAGLAAAFCATPAGWGKFLEWTRERGIVIPEENVSRHVMEASSKAIDVTCREIEARVLAARMNLYLDELG